MTAVCYFLGCIPALLFCSRLPNRLGRKPVVVLALTIGAISSLAVIFATSPLHIMLARVGQGFACGLASGSAMAWIFDSTPAHNRSISAMLAASGPGIGFLFGALAAAIAYELFAISYRYVFIGLFVGLVTVLVLSLFGKETITRPTGTLWQTLAPKLEIPKRLKKNTFWRSPPMREPGVSGAFFKLIAHKLPLTLCIAPICSRLPLFSCPLLVPTH